MKELFVKSAFLSSALVIVLVIPLAAHAAGDGEIRKHLLAVGHLYEEVEYDHALQRIQLARQLPCSTEDEVTLSLYEGIILCEMSNQTQGAAAFKAALLLRPEAKLPVRVAPKIETLFQTVQQQVKSELASLAAPREAEPPKERHVEATPRPLPSVALPPTAVSSSAPRREALRRHALIPALAGGALAVAGGVSWTLSRGELGQLRGDDARLATMDDVRRSMSRGNTLQTVGIGLLSAGAVGLAVSAGMYMLGAPEPSLALGVSTDGTSAFVQGKWP